MKEKKYKSAVIGCGKIGTERGDYSKNIFPATHADAYNENQRTELIALVDTDLKKIKKAEKYFPGVRFFNSAEEMFKKVKPDIISIATPPKSHYDLVKLSAEFETKSIICEKPISNILEEAEEMIKICKKNNSLLFINHQRRFDPLLGKWRDKMQKGFLGKIVQADCYYYNGLYSNGTHTVDLLRFFLGDIDWVRGWFNSGTSNSKDKFNVDALLFFKNGSRVFLHTLPKNYAFSNYYFYGTKGRLSIENLGHRIVYQKLIKNKNYKGYYQLSASTKIQGENRSFMKAMINNVVKCLDKKEKPLSSGEDGLATFKILSLIEQSAKNKKQIKVI